MNSLPSGKTQVTKKSRYFLTIICREPTFLNNIFQGFPLFVNQMLITMKTAAYWHLFNKNQEGKQPN